MTARGLVVVALLAGACGDGAQAPRDMTAAPTCTPVDAGAPEPAAVQEGFALVQRYRCQQCHGEVLDGNYDGVFVPNSTRIAYPPNLTPDPATGLGCWSDDQIVRAILDGIDDEGMGLCAPMPRFATLGLDDAGARRIVAFLRSLPPSVNQVPDTPDCSCASDGDCPTGESCSAARTCSCDGLCVEVTASPDGAVTDASCATADGDDAEPCDGAPATDAAPDLSLVDAAPDLSLVDAAPDLSLDAAPDLTVDAAPDLAVAAAPDLGVDGGHD